MFDGKELKQELWKDIPGYENKYQISNLGRFRNNKIIMKPMIATNGYLIACLWKDNQQKKIVIHKLVAQAFLENPLNYKEINHIDEDKTNNKVSNLEWCTHKYNMNYGKIKEKIGNANRNKKPNQETRLKLSNNSKNRIWINNSYEEKLIKPEEKEKYNQWKLGRLKKEKK